MIISFDGLDGSGKTTQIENLKNKLFNDYYLGNAVVLFLDGELSPHDYHDWWFNKSTPDEFCDILYKAIKKRQDNIKNNSLIDKDIATFDARIWATLVLKGVTKSKAYKKLVYYKLKYQIHTISDIRVLLVNNTNNEKVECNDYSLEEIKLYKKYRKLQEEFLKQLIENNYFSLIYNVDCSVDELSEKIYNDCNGLYKHYYNRDDTIKINALKIPDREKQIIKEVFDEVKKIEKSNLTGFLIHGSISRNQYIPKWSDIDILIFTKIYNYKHLEKIDNFVKKYDVKIGITSISNYELNNYLFDSKSYYSIYSYESGKINSMIYKKNLNLKPLSLNDIKNKNMAVIPEQIHSLKREVYNINSDKRFKEIFKKLTLVMKVSLINNYNLFSMSYYQTTRNFNYIYNICDFDIDKIVYENNYEEMFKYAVKVLNIIGNGGKK